MYVSKCFSKAPDIRSYRSLCSCFPRKVSFQLSSEQSVGDVWIAQLDRKGVPQARSSDCESSVAVTAECSRHHASRNLSWPQRAPSAVRHEAAIICQLERRPPGQLLANQTCHFELGHVYRCANCKTESCHYADANRHFRSEYISRNLRQSSVLAKQVLFWFCP